MKALMICVGVGLALISVFFGVKPISSYRDTVYPFFDHTLVLQIMFAIPSGQFIAYKRTPISKFTWACIVALGGLGVRVATYFLMDY